MTRYNEGWKNKIKACDDLDGGSDEMAEEIWTPEKRWKHLELEFIHREQTPKKRINHLDEITIRFIVCLSFIKLNWWQAMDLAWNLFFLKRIEKWHITTLRRSSWTTGRIEKNERIKMILKEKESWTNHRKNSKIEWRKRMNHREELEEPIC